MTQDTPGLTMCDNPYQPVWVGMDERNEDVYRKGMAARIADEGCEGVIAAIRSGDADHDADGYHWYPPMVTVSWSDGVEDRYNFDEIEVKEYEYEAARVAHQGYLAKLQAKNPIPVSTADFAPKGAVEDDNDDIPF